MNYTLVVVLLSFIFVGSIQPNKSPDGQPYILPFLDKVKCNEPLTDEDFNTLLYGTNLVISECEDTLYTHGLDINLQKSTEGLLLNVKSLLTKYCKNNDQLSQSQVNIYTYQIDKVESFLRILEPEASHKHTFRIFKK